jgi:hypothetical protein
MTFVCAHCGGTTFRLLTGIDGRTSGECLTCGRASSFDQSTARKAPAAKGAGGDRYGDGVAGEKAGQ